MADGNLAGLDESGNLTDSGKKPGDFQAKLNRTIGGNDNATGTVSGTGGKKSGVQRAGADHEYGGFSKKRYWSW
ncbi:MAG: hypothetical protein LBV17_03605 [Treponema sp.]|nr:hypothetical protein [Treponema sp.]